MLLRTTISLLITLAILFPGLLSAADEYWEYTFRPGDSIWKIAEKYTTSVDNWIEIQELNKIRQGPDRRIPPGTRILIPISMLKIQPTPAIVIAVDGSAVVARADGEEIKAAIGMKLYSGDRVITAKAQRLRLQFADKSELQILQRSVVVLDKLSHYKKNGMVDTRIRLNSGSVNTWVEKLKSESRYEISTPAAITAVRGTAFRLSSDEKQISRTEVTEGLVGVSAGGVEKSVSEGYGIVAEKDKPLPEPVKLLPPPGISDNRSADRNTIAVSLAAPDGLEAYRYRLASDEKFTQVIVDSTTGDDTIEIGDLEPGRYYLSVRGVDRYSLEGLDAVNVFDIQEAPPAQDPLWLVPVSVGILILIL